MGNIIYISFSKKMPIYFFLLFFSVSYNFEIIYFNRINKALIICCQEEDYLKKLKYNLV